MFSGAPRSSEYNLNPFASADSLKPGWAYKAVNESRKLCSGLEIRS